MDKDPEQISLPYPKAVWFIIANEFCERFSFYGLKTILSLYLRDKLGFSDDAATTLYHLFTMLAYFFPILGAIIADGCLGKFRTILYLSVVYVTGTTLLSISAMPNLPALALAATALFLIAFGTGGIKPCVAAFGGDQFKLPEQEKQLGYFFSLFYFSINSGSLISTSLTPVLRSDVHCFGENNCYPLAFGVPAILMIIAVVFFIIGRKLYVVPAASGSVIQDVFCCVTRAIGKKFSSKAKREHWLDHADDKYDKSLIEDVKCVLRVLVLFLPLPVFWALFDQQGSRWTFQADRMNQQIGGGITLKPDQMQVLNPLLVLLLIPLFQTVIFPCLEKMRLITKPLHKMIAGGMLAASSFVVSGIVELQLVSSNGTPLRANEAQLRIYNAMNCQLQLNGDFLPSGVAIPPLSVFEDLHIASTGDLSLPYSINGTGDCETVTFSGNFKVSNMTATSYIVSKEGLSEFTDDPSKAVDSIRVRFITDPNAPQSLGLVKPGTNEVVYNSDSAVRTSQKLSPGRYDVYNGSNKLISNFDFQTGGAYAVIVDKDTAEVATVVPENFISILWLIPQYVLISVGEVMFSVTGLEFSFTQAPNSMKSVLQAAWLLTVAFGNVIVILIVQIQIMDEQWKEFFLFAGLMFVDMLIFTVMAWRYKYVDRTNDSSVPKTNGQTSQKTNFTDISLTKTRDSAPEPMPVVSLPTQNDEPTRGESQKSK